MDPIFLLKSSLRVKPKDRQLGVNIKKHSQTEAVLDDSTHCKPSRFAYKKGKNKRKNILVKRLDLKKSKKEAQGR